MTIAPYIAILAIMTALLAIHVISRRQSAKILIGEDGDQILMRRVRAFGNLTEYAPILIAILMACEFAGIDGWKLHLLGIMIIVGRLAHAISFQEFITGATHMRFRVMGMILTLSSLILGSVFLLLGSF